ncbi:adenylate/guanylate cyclase domain-containing protein [Chachezhania antarctica]|uniref:adenylate/guanylate cyclase domain-containing protein n=1 Tax=Chachezhania antarctica TaxID=2340860 RepID=UPI001F08BB8D|nr:adenylate/guanylate cyclase domain-containing protein [Chachezhania antarctica]
MTALWRGSWATRARIASGLVLFAFALTHFLNIGLGLFSAELMAQMQDWRVAVTRFPPVTALLILAILVHAGLALMKVAQKRSLRMAAADWVQLVLGFLIPFFLIAHVVHTHVAHVLYDVDDSFAFLIRLVWGTTSGLQQCLLLLIVWTHACIGLHMWLRLTRWWARWTPVLSGVAVLIPAYALTGYLVEGRRIVAATSDPETFQSFAASVNWPDGAAFTRLAQISDRALIVFLCLLAAAMCWNILRRIIAGRSSIRVHYIDGPDVHAQKGMTLLAMSKVNNVPHTALCGGRGRCSTCRVIVETGGEDLPPPEPGELRTLRAVRAPPNARLACQIRPMSDLTVFRVFQPDGRRGRAHASQGEERRLAILFLDMRGFTARTSGQLPYDVVFLLNRFFDAVVPPIQRVGGTVDKYLGDGFLAVFETADAESSARAALEAIRQIGSALDGFNEALKVHGDPEIKIGVGVHLGLLVLGEIGAAGNAPRTLIGDTVNTASRLEAQTKVEEVELLISDDVLTAAGIDTSGLPLQDFDLRGLDTPLRALAVPQCSNLDANLAIDARNEE